MSEDITLSQFMSMTDAKNKGNGIWDIDFTLKNNIRSTLQVLECKSEFEAKERAYLYLIDLIKNK